MTRTATRFWIVAAMIACASLVLCQLADIRGGAIVSKIAASSAFLITALGSGALRSRFGQVILAGLVLSAFGDVFLLWSAPSLFLLGLISFLLAHLAYIAAFLSHGIDVRWSAATIVPVAVLSLAVSMWLTPYVSTDMLIPVRVYTIVISVMVAAAFGARGAGGSWLMPIGATLFYISDLAVATDRFVTPGFPMYVWGLPLYYSGQLMLALCVRSTGRRARA